MEIPAQLLEQVRFDSWFLNFKLRGGTHYRFSLDSETGRHIDTKSEAETEATKIRAAILAGTFRAKPQAPSVIPAMIAGTSA
ncbi:MAG: hypothetical protein DMF95_26050 [Acidobacteria bacterium]|nr:MAG: hypothetical protein DMF95_26050 [Acidobacteriota bacterium]